MAFLQESGDDKFVFHAQYHGGNANLKQWMCIVTDSYDTVIAPGYFDDWTGPLPNAGDELMVFTVTDRRDLSTVIDWFILTVQEWNVSYRSLREGMVSSERFGTVGDGLTDDTVALQNAINFSSTYNIPVFIPRGTYLIDGYKGAFSSWSSTNGGGLWLKTGARLWGAGRGSTILKNYVDDWRMVIGIKGNTTGVEIKHLTVDGDIDNHPNIILGDPTSATVDDKRGEGIIFYGGGLISFEIEDVEVKNTGHYGIGIQNVKILKGSVLNTHFANIGGDCIDVKAFSSPDYSKAIIINGVWTQDGCGHNYVGGSGVSPHNNQAVVDVRGKCIVSNVYIEGLDSYGTSLGAGGVRISPPVNSENRLGGAGSMASNIRVKSSKLANEGTSDTVKRIIGIVVADADCQVSDVEVDGCFWGISVRPSGDGTPFRVNVSNFRALNCTGAADDGVGIQVTDDCRDIKMTNIIADSCNYGFTLDGQRGSYSNLTASNNTVQGLSATDVFYSRNSVSGVHFVSNASAVDAPLLDVISRSGVFSDGLVVVKERGGMFTGIATANDSAWTGPDAILSGLQVYSADESGPGAGRRAGIFAEMTNADGSGGTRWRFETTDATDPVDSLILTGNTVAAQLPVTYPVYAQAALPTGIISGRAFCNDSNATLAAGIGNTVAGGGANLVPVYFDGTNWKIG